jgi:hypothetical protein
MEIEDRIGNWYVRNNDGKHRYYGAVSFIQLVKVLPSIRSNNTDEFVQVIEIRNYIEKYNPSPIEPSTSLLIDEVEGPNIDELNFNDKCDIRNTRLYECYLKEMVFPYPVSRDLSVVLDLYCVGRGII